MWNERVKARRTLTQEHRNCGEGDFGGAGARVLWRTPGADSAAGADTRMAETEAIEDREKTCLTRAAAGPIFKRSVI